MYNLAKKALPIFISLCLVISSIPAELLSKSFLAPPQSNDISDILKKKPSVTVSNAENMPADVKHVKILNINSLPLEQLIVHLSNIDQLRDLDPEKINWLAQWIIYKRTFRDKKQLLKELSSTPIPGFNKKQQKAVAEYFEVLITRRTFISYSVFYFSLISVIALGIKRVIKDISDSNFYNQPKKIIKEKFYKNIEKLFSENKMTGELVQAIVEKQGIEIKENHNLYGIWNNFIHALNTSDWIEASLLLFNTKLFLKIENTNENTFIKILFNMLENIRDADSLVKNDKEAKEAGLSIVYKFGKYPTIVYNPALLVDKFKLMEKTSRLIKILEMNEVHFKVFESLNQINRKPAITSAGGFIRVCQESNLSYAHGRIDLKNKDLFDPKRRTAIVNWSAYSDCHSSFYDPDMFKRLFNAKTYPELVEYATQMYDSSWILPLLYNYIHSSNYEPMEIIWVVPKEVLKRKDEYGVYTFKLIYSHKTSELAWINFESKSDTTSDDKSAFTKKITMHYVDPDDLDSISKTIGNAQVFLGVSADFCGTTHSNEHLLKSLPIYNRMGPFFASFPLNKNADEEARHKQLIERFGDFYECLKDQIKSVSIAHSPRTTADEQRRQPVSEILRCLIGKNLDNQPEWVMGEYDRSIPPSSPLSFISKKIYKYKSLYFSLLLLVLSTLEIQITEIRNEKKKKRKFVFTKPLKTPDMPVIDSVKSHSTRPLKTPDMPVIDSVKSH